MHHKDLENLQNVPKIMKIKAEAFHLTNCLSYLHLLKYNNL